MKTQNLYFAGITAMVTLGFTLLPGCGPDTPDAGGVHDTGSIPDGQVCGLHM